MTISPIISHDGKNENDFHEAKNSEMNRFEKREGELAVRVLQCSRPLHVHNFSIKSTNSWGFLRCCSCQYLYLYLDLCSVCDDNNTPILRCIQQSARRGKIMTEK